MEKRKEKGKGKGKGRRKGNSTKEKMLKKSGLLNMEQMKYSGRKWNNDWYRETNISD